MDEGVAQTLRGAAAPGGGSPGCQRSTEGLRLVVLNFSATRDRDPTPTTRLLFPAGYQLADPGLVASPRIKHKPSWLPTHTGAQAFNGSRKAFPGQDHEAGVHTLVVGLAGPCQVSRASGHSPSPVPPPGCWLSHGGESGPQGAASGKKTVCKEGPGLPHSCVLTSDVQLWEDTPLLCSGPLGAAPPHCLGEETEAQRSQLLARGWQAPPPPRCCWGERQFSFPHSHA